MLSVQMLMSAQDTSLLAGDVPSRQMASAIEALDALGQAYVEPDTWRQLSDQRHTYQETIRHIQSISEVLPADGKVRTLDVLATLRVDPWAGVDQTNTFIPKLPPLNYWNGVPVETSTPGSIPLAIPYRYRLAEAMGIGTNAVHLEISGEDGELFANVGFGYHIAQLFRHALIGQFWTTGNSFPIQTFRRTILGRERMNTQDIFLGPEVKPHQKSLKRHPIQALERTASGKRVWAEERLDLRFPQGFDEWILSPEERAAQHSLELRVEQAIMKQLRDWKTEITNHQWRQCLSRGIPDKLDTLRSAFIKWESAHQEETCSLSLRATQLITSPWLHSRLESQVQDKHAWNFNQADRRRMEVLLHASIAHGLYHRVPVDVREQALLCWMKIMEVLTWQE